MPCLNYHVVITVEIMSSKKFRIVKDLQIYVYIFSCQRRKTKISCGFSALRVKSINNMESSNFSAFPNENDRQIF